MITRLSFSSNRLLAACLPLLSALAALAQEAVPLAPPAKVAAHLTFPADRALDLKSASGVFELVELLPGESVSIKATFPTELAGQTFAADLLDGGQVAVGEGQSLTTSAEGLLSFSFTAGTDPGTYRVSLRHGEQHWEMPFSVPNPSYPAGDPGALVPEETVEPASTPAPSATPEPTVTPEPSVTPEGTLTAEPTAPPEATTTPADPSAL